MTLSAEQLARFEEWWEKNSPGSVQFKWLAKDGYIAGYTACQRDSEAVVTQLVEALKGQMEKLNGIYEGPVQYVGGKHIGQLRAEFDAALRLAVKEG